MENNYNPYLEHEINQLSQERQINNLKDIPETIITEPMSQNHTQ